MGEGSSWDKYPDVEQKYRMEEVLNIPCGYAMFKLSEKDNMDFQI